MSLGRRLLLLRGEQPEEHVPVLVVQGGHVHAEGVGHVVEVEAKGLEQRQKVDLLTRLGVLQLGARPVAVRPAAPVDQLEVALAG